MMNHLKMIKEHLANENNFLKKDHDSSNKKGNDLKVYWFILNNLLKIYHDEAIKKDNMMNEGDYNDLITSSKVLFRSSAINMPIILFLTHTYCDPPHL